MLSPHAPRALRRGSAISWISLVAVAMSCSGFTEARAKGKDPAERGLDLFIHATPAAIAGDALSLDLIAYGFPTVTSAQPLPNATIEVAWDPESLGAGVDKAPAEISTTTNADGRAHMEVPVPLGEARKLTLLVAIHHGEHVRTRKVEVDRAARLSVELRIPDASIVPGSHAPAWVTVTDARDGGPIRGAAVDVTLMQGDVERHRERVTTDASGMTRTSLYVPITASDVPPLAIRARLVGQPSGAPPIESFIPVHLREETPATPRMTVAWREQQLKPGEVGHIVVKVVDATDEPVAGREVTYWTGPKGTTPPATDEAWSKSGKTGRTNGLGELELSAQAPRVVTSLGSDLTVVARAVIEGQKLEQRRTVLVGQPVASADLEVEGGALVPGVTQRGYLHISDGEHGVAGDFSIEGDGLRAQVTTDARGDGELTWTVPDDVGAQRGKGPCAGGVAASVIVRQSKPLAALSRHPEPFELCVHVDREERAILRTSVHVAKIGDTVHATLFGTKRLVDSDAASVMLSTPAGFGISTWATRPAKANALEADINLSKATMGMHTLTVATPQGHKPAVISGTHLLVVPKVLPKVQAKIAGGHITPGGEAEIDVTLSDGHGAAITGAVSAVVIDKEGGGSVDGLERIDTRTYLCDQARAPREACDAFLEGDAGAETLRRSLITTAKASPLAPLSDPAAHATASLNQTFSDVLHSLEGAVFQSQTPESLRDIRRRENGRWVFNPELMTLVTASMTEAPTTPGGEPFGLADLLAVDSQVTFDNVARRITRLKLFNVLAAVRQWKQDQRVDSDEPVWSDPNALLRRLVRDGSLSQEGLLDPWGGTIEFVKTTAPAVPFLTATRGYALASPGPDGKIGTPDDVRDPFERVVRSKTPYATAMGEDEIVDAKWDMRVGDATVSGWQEMFARLTGTTLGSGGGTGTGQGFGSGHGRLGGSHAVKTPSIRHGAAIATETARWTEPQRTDAQGRVRLRVPLGDYETTWRIALLARTDAAATATTVVDVPTFLPVSAHADVGRKLTVGDEVGARIVVRNRTPSPKPVTLELSTEGGLSLAPNGPRVMTVEVPPNAIRSVFARVIAKAEGRGRLLVNMRAPGTDGDRTSQEVGVEPAGEARIIATSTYLTTKAALRAAVPPGYLLRGAARLVVESGVEDALLGTLSAVDPDANTSSESLADAIEIAKLLERHAEAQGKRWLVARAKDLDAISRAHLATRNADEGARARIALERAKLFVPDVPTPKKPRRPAPNQEPPGCPRSEDVDALPVALLLEAEPPPQDNGPLPCFTSLSAKTASREPIELARASLALYERPHRRALATTLATELARITKADTDGATLSFDGSRAERVIILAALIRTAHLWSRTSERLSHRLLEQVLTLRDARGGFGSTEATRDVVRVLVDIPRGKTPSPSRVEVTDESGRKQIVTVAPNDAKTITLGQSSREVQVAVTGEPLVVRLERPTLRTWSATPETTRSPMSVSVDWPNDAKTGMTGVVHVTIKNGLGRSATLFTRVPLPPGVELAATVKDVSVRQGVLHIRTTTSSTETVALPLRFTLPGLTTVPEAETRATSEELGRAVAPARALIVR